MRSGEHSLGELPGCRPSVSRGVEMFLAMLTGTLARRVRAVAARLGEAAPGA